MRRQVKVLLLGESKVVTNPEHTSRDFTYGSADSLIYLKEQVRAANLQS
jgi:hypothetical protein